MDKVIRHTSDPPTPLASLRRGLPAALVAVVEKMMAKNPADRYQTPAEVIAALGSFVLDPGPPPADPPATPALARAGNVWWLWVAGAAVVSAAVVGLWLLSR
jgi:hypothetical protein